jgi:hypothetical protein
MHAFLFTCPTTGQKVQGSTATEPPFPDFEAVMCTACNRTHLVNPMTGKVAGASVGTSSRDQ